MARPFRFRLDVVQRVRKQERDAKRRALADELRLQAHAEAQAEKLRQDIDSTAAALRVAVRGPKVDVELVRCHESLRAFLQRQLEEQLKTLAARRRDVDEARTAVGEATRRYAVLDKLRTRRWNQHLQILKREEQGLQDEISLQICKSRDKKRAARTSGGADL